MLLLDHVVFAVRDLDAAAERLLAEHGLASVDGGVHDGVGTANRIVPLGETYVELMGIDDERVAEGNPFGRYLVAFLEGGDRLLVWAVATDDIATTARWIGTQPIAWTRQRPDGVELRWRLAGLEGSMADRSLPFFIQWDCPRDDHPGRQRAEHRSDVKGITELEIAGKATKIRNRVNGAELPVRVVAGESGLRSVTIATSDGEIVLS